MPTFFLSLLPLRNMTSIFLSKVYSHANDFGTALTNVFQNLAQTLRMSLLPLDSCLLPTYRLMSTLKILTATKQSFHQSCHPSQVIFPPSLNGIKVPLVCPSSPITLTPLCYLVLLIIPSSRYLLSLSSV